MSDDEINLAIERITGQRREYCQDFNAMHMAEAYILDKPMNGIKSMQYIGWLKQVIGEGKGYTIHATARQRAEAFLRTLGKWKE